MKNQKNILDELPLPTQEIVRPVWRRLSSQQRSEFEELLGQLPTSLTPLKDILGLVLDQYKPVFGTKRRIAVLGPANVGKSTLYNQLIARQEDEAEVGPTPGTTRQTQDADTGLFTLTDTPGADAVGEVGRREREIAFRAANRADFLVIMFEATRGVRRYEKELFDDLLALDKPFIVVLNKMDLVPRRDRETVIESAAGNLRLDSSQVIDTVATQGTNVGRVILAVAKLEPELLAAIAQAVPEYRARLAWGRIVPAAGAAGVIGLIPLPLVDLVPLLGIQSGLVLSVARIYGYKITLSRARELIATLGVGIIARTVFQQLSKLGGVPGWILSASIAAATTVAIGQAAVLWFAYGEQPTREMLQGITVIVAQAVRDQLMSLDERRPDRGTVRERISEALTDLPERLRPGSGTPTLADEDQSELDAEPSSS